MTSQTALYRHFDSDGALLYVGITKDPAKRFALHCATKGWAYDVTTIRIEWFATKSAALQAESKAIASEGPRYNFQHISAGRTKTAAPVGPVKHPELIAEIEAFCKRTGFAKTAVGNMCVNDPSLVKNLCDGRELRASTIAQIRNTLEALSA